jgi:small-conductance mechanosensitive channel
LLIILGGFLLSNLARAAIVTAAQRAALEQSTLMARAAQIVIIFSAIIIGVEQIGLNIGFLSTLSVVVIAILLAGASLAFSLGARDLVANVIGAQYTRRHCRVGDHLRIGAVEGEIVEVSQSSIVVTTVDGRAVIPAKLFHEQVCFITPAQNLAPKADA